MAIIMISRGTFSGGKAVAEGLAARLNYPCVSNEIIFDAAEEFNVPEERLNAVLNEPPKVWRQRPGRQVAHLNFVRAVLLKRVSEGNLVYHGNAGHLLLTDIAHVLRVRVVADMEFRIKAAVHKESVDRARAKEMIAALDRKIARWTHILYGVDWQDPALYDVTVNLENMALQSAVDIVAFMTGLPDFMPTPASHKAFADLQLGSRVWAELAKNPFTKSVDVRVTADDGVVTVTGKAGSHKIVGLIPAIVADIEGVKAVCNEVGVGSDWMW